MRALLLLFAFFFSSHVFAATSVALQPPSNVGGSVGSYITRGSATFSSASFNSAMSASVAGRAVTVPASWRLASNAGQFAVSAIRLNPSALLAGAALAWLLEYGLSYNNGQFQKTSASTGAIPQLSEADGRAIVCAGWGCSIYDAVNSDGVKDDVFECRIGSGGNTDIYHQSWRSQYKTYWPMSHWAYVPTSGTYVCPVGYSLSGTSCVGVPVPATDADWAQPSAAALPDAVATELASKGVPLPLLDPIVSTTPLDVPISDPYVSPTDGKRYQDVARLTPQNTPPSTAIVETAKQEVDANGNPVTDPATGNPVKPTPEQKDPCELHPERIGCSEFGSPDNGDALPNQERGVSSITVQSFGSSASCPADIQLPKGAHFSFDWPCQMATAVKPFLLALAWLLAGMIVIGALRND